MVRILVVGDPSTKFAKVSRKLVAQNKKSGPFQCALLLCPPGEVPADFSCPIPTHFAAQEYESSSVPRKVRPNLFYVGPCAALVVEGVSIVLLAGGYDDPKSAALPPEVEAALHRAGALGAGFRGVDVLATCSLPRGVAVGGEDVEQSALAGEVALRLRPRYHFGSGSQYAALPPFVCAGADHGTRFMAIAGFEAPKRGGKAEKWVYAADVTPLAAMTDEQRAETSKTRTRAPYVGIVRNGAGDRLQQAAARITNEVMEAGKPAQFFWNVRGRGEKRRGGQGGQRRRKVRKASIETPVDAACWFCLANEKDMHLVVDVGEHMYLAMAKGSLNDNHLLIVPVDHVHSSLDERLTDEMERELEMYQKAVKRYFREALDGAGAYFFERAVHTRGGAKQMHMHVNAIPIPKGRCEHVLQNAEEVAKNFEIVLEKLTSEEPAVEVDAVVGDSENGKQDDAKTEVADPKTEHAAQEGSEHAPKDTDDLSLENKMAPSVPDVDVVGAGVTSIRTETRTLTPSKELLKDIASEEKQVGETAADEDANTPIDSNEEAPIEEDLFVEKESQAEVEETHVSRLRSTLSSQDQFFYAELPCGTRLLHRPVIGEDGRGKHPLHFGRGVVAVTLGRPDLVDWKVCVQSAEVESAKTEKLRERIQEFLSDLDEA